MKHRKLSRGTEMCLREAVICQIGQRLKEYFSPWCKFLGNFKTWSKNNRGFLQPSTFLWSWKVSTSGWREDNYGAEIGEHSSNLLDLMGETFSVICFVNPVKKRQTALRKQQPQMLEAGCFVILPMVFVWQWCVHLCSGELIMTSRSCKTPSSTSTVASLTCRRSVTPDTQTGLKYSARLTVQPQILITLQQR